MATILLSESLNIIVLFTFITDFFDDKDSAFKSTETTPKIRNIIEYVSNLERIKNWIEKRPNSVF